VNTTEVNNNRLLATLATLIFGSRWLQAPLYLGLIFAQGVYVYRFMQELAHLAIQTLTVPSHDFKEEHLMLAVLGLVDVAMIANLLNMVIMGGYETFVSRLRKDNHPDIPDWLGHVNAGTMKIKLATALIGISSIHLLKSFINVEHLPDRAVVLQVVIHVTFVLSAMAMAYTAWLMGEISHGEVPERKPESTSG